MTIDVRPASRRVLIRTLTHLGFDGPFSGKRHQFMRRGSLKLRIPNVHQGDISADLLKDILKQAAVSVEDWNRALGRR